MPHGKTGQPTGYWWQCSADSSHVVTHFATIAKKPLVQFLYDLAASDWNQNLLRVPCSVCENGELRITYDFPRQVDQVRLSVIHIVGLTDNLPGYLPMLWEATPHHEVEPWFDFKYVGRSDRGYQSYGLARPAVFSRSDLVKLFDTYRRVVGYDALSQEPSVR
jgi:hypothetical protein